MRAVLLIYVALAICGCQTNTVWPLDGTPPTLGLDDIDSLPETFKVEYIVNRFGPGFPDPNTFLGLYYVKEGGGGYLVTWYPTPEVPGDDPPKHLNERKVLNCRVTAVFDLSIQSDTCTYVYPTELRGKELTGWQCDMD